VVFDPEEIVPNGDGLVGGVGKPDTDDEVDSAGEGWLAGACGTGGEKTGGAAG